MIKVSYQSNDSYEFLLECSNIFFVDQYYLQFLLTEIVKSVLNKNPEFTLSYFTHKGSSHNLSSGSGVFSPNTK